MAETMTALVERHRAYLAAYSAADFGSDQIAGEEAWLATADTEAADLIEGETPRLLDKTDLLAAVSYLIEDRGFIQQGHRNILQRVMEYLTEHEIEPVSVGAEVQRQAACALSNTTVSSDAEPNDGADRNATARITTSGQRWRRAAYRNWRDHRVPAFCRPFGNSVEA